MLAMTNVPDLYRERMLVGTSLRIDYGAPRLRWQTYWVNRNYFSPARLQRSLQFALATSERYVWIYSEQRPRFFPPRYLPKGYIKAIETARQTSGVQASSSLLPGLSLEMVGTAAAVAVARRHLRAKTQVPQSFLQNQ